MVKYIFGGIYENFLFQSAQDPAGHFTPLFLQVTANTNLNLKRVDEKIDPASFCNGIDC